MERNAADRAWVIGVAGSSPPRAAWRVHTCRLLAVAAIDQGCQRSQGGPPSCVTLYLTTVVHTAGSTGTEDLYLLFRRAASIADESWLGSATPSQRFSIESELSIKRVVGNSRTPNAALK